MAVYNIPGITTSVLDLTHTTATTSSGRSVLLAGLSKYGTEELMEFGDALDVDLVLGKENHKKYGLGIKYLKGALTRTNKAYFKRLLPDDATYSNVSISNTFGITTKANVIDTETLKIDDNIFDITAKARGNGYDSLFVQFSAAPDLEKLYADEEGDLNYRFNFLRADIYENNPAGLKAVSRSILFSLIDDDPQTGVPILDMNTSKELFINQKFGTSNNFLDAQIPDSKISSLYEQLSIDEICANNDQERLVLTDTVTGTNYEITVNDEGGFELKAVQITGKAEEFLSLVTTASNGEVITKKYKIFIENKVLGTDVYYGDNVAFDKLKINGTTAFYDLYINDQEALDKAVISFPRYELFNKLIDNKFQLSSGFDGENLVINNRINMYGPGDSVKQNAKQLLINYYNFTPDIREVMYPKYDFDYLPDWSEDMDVMTAISNLGDELGFSMPIVSMGLSYNAEEDYNKRREDFIVNSYNTCIYSGQNNLSHYDASTGGTIMIPHSYLAMLIHLDVDDNYSITEPAANKNKATIPDAKLQLSYQASSKDIEKLREVQINTIINEVDGIYEIDQLTAYKKASKLSRINIVKPIHRMRKDLPRLLKDFIQVKALNNQISRVQEIVNKYMAKYQVSDENIADGIFSSIKVFVYFIEEENKLIVSITVNPIGTIETISIPITVI